jgi:hypothetical protein
VQFVRDYYVSQIMKVIITYGRQIRVRKNKIGSVHVSLNGHAAKLVIKHLEREGWGFKQIRSSSKEMEKEKKN